MSEIDIKPGDFIEFNQSWADDVKGKRFLILAVRKTQFDLEIEFSTRGTDFGRRIQRDSYVQSIIGDRLKSGAIKIIKAGDLWLQH